VVKLLFVTLFIEVIRLNPIDSNFSQAVSAKEAGINQEFPLFPEVDTC